MQPAKTTYNQPKTPTTSQRQPRKPTTNQNHLKNVKTTQNMPDPSKYTKFFTTNLLM